MISKKIFSKILQIMHDKVYDYNYSKNYFRKCSTIRNFRKLNPSKISRYTVFDISKAFDSIPRKELLIKQSI